MQKSLVITALSNVALLVGVGNAQHAAGQDLATTYPTMVSADAYLMADRSAEVALARSAAPESISHDAEVLVLGRQGFDVAINGKNGFVCSWGAAGHPQQILITGIRKCGFRCV